MSHREWFETARAEILAQEHPPSATVLDTDGTTYNQICHAIAAAADAVSARAAGWVDGLFLDTARGDALARLGADRYGVTRQGVTRAQVTLALARPSAAYGAVTLPAGLIARTPDGIRFETTAPVAFAAASTGPAAVRAWAINPGSDGNISENQTFQWETPPEDPTITATNPERAAGGQGAESDEHYRARIRAAYLAHAQGTLTAITQGALAVAGIHDATAFETLDEHGRPLGSVQLVIADEAGTANSALAEDVAHALREVRPAGIAVFLIAGEPVYEAVSVSVAWKPGLATAANALAVRQAIVAWVNRLTPRAAPAGTACEDAAKLTPGIIQAAARSVAGVADVVVLAPAGTVVPDPGQVIRTTLAQTEIIA